MRTTITLDDHLIAEASRATGVKERSRLIHDGLRALIARENARAIVALGGSDPDAWVPDRRRSRSG
jgi:Arc/MetJ family transcription regulator